MERRARLHGKAVDTRVTALLSLVLFGCTAPPPPSAPPAPPADLAPRPPPPEPPPPDPEPPPLPPRVAATPPRPRPDPAIAQAVLELQHNPRLHLLLVGSGAADVRKAMLRAGHGKIADDRIHTAVGDLGHGPAPHVAYHFYVPDERPLERRLAANP